MDIRLLNQEDVDIWKALRLEMLQNTPESFETSYEEAIHYSESDWKNSLNTSDIFGAFLNDKLVASAGFFTLNTLKTKHRGVLFAMYTTPEHRKKGLANRLIETVITHAKSHAIQLHLGCVTSNLVAMKFYQKHGFKIYGTEPRTLKISHEFFDEYLMVLDLTTLI